MAKQKVYFDADFNPVAKGSATSAFIFNASDDRIPRFRQQVKDAKAAATRTAEAGPVEEEEAEATTERVGTARRRTP